MNKTLKEAISLVEALNNLEAVASIDLEAPEPIGILSHNRIHVGKEGVPNVEVQWFSGEGSEILLEALDATFHSIQQYLFYLVQTTDLAESEKFVASMMALVGDATSKMEGYLASFLKKPVSKIIERASYRSLLGVYEQHFAKFSHEKEPHNVDTMAIRNMDAVRKDQDYDLFCIRHEDGKPYFNFDILRHMRVISDFDAKGENFEEDPLLQIRALTNRDMHAAAKQILETSHETLSEFFKISRKANNNCSSFLSQAAMALFLAANPRYLEQTNSGKSCTEYFSDFHQFLRSALKTQEYQKLIAYPPEKEDRAARLLLRLTHCFCSSLFSRKCGIKQEMIGLIHRTTRKGNEIVKKGHSFWEKFLIDDENYRAYLNQFPNGPFLKTLELIQETKEVPFDPLVQGNLPSQLFVLKENSQDIQVLHLPAPTRQIFINKAEMIGEWRGFLREKKQKHLLINLQDRNSWKEHTRCHVLEEFQNASEFNPFLCVVTIPKNTDFYFQVGEHLHINQASEFTSNLIKQLENPKESGFYIPTKKLALHPFVEQIVPLIHRHFFEQKNTLTRREREDFIEIFYHFLVLKIIDQFHPHSMSFSCKDGLDTGAAFSASFYAFLKMWTEGFDKKETQDYFRFLLYAPSLLVRERAIDAERVQRTVSALQCFHRALEERGKGEELGSIVFLNQVFVV